ncbi:hypothetical protein STEG23_031693, partial [Scotinomys teguina]
MSDSLLSVITGKKMPGMGRVLGLTQGLAQGLAQCRALASMGYTAQCTVASSLSTADQKPNYVRNKEDTNNQEKKISNGVSDTTTVPRKGSATEKVPSKAIRFEKAIQKNVFRRKFPIFLLFPHTPVQLNFVPFSQEQWLLSAYNCKAPRYGWRFENHWLEKISLYVCTLFLYLIIVLWTHR